MPTLKYLEESFDCATAIKGDDYIHLLDDSGVMVAAFDNITDFSGFSLEDGEYTTPTADHDCHVAVVRDDGTLGKGGHKCSEIMSKTAVEEVLAMVRLAEFCVPEEGEVYALTVDLSGVDMSQYAKLTLTGRCPATDNGYTHTVRLRINGNATSGDYQNGTMAYVNGTSEKEGSHGAMSYITVGRNFQSDSGCFMEITLCDGWSHTPVQRTCLITNYEDEEGDPGVLRDWTQDTEWENGRLQDIQQLEITYHDDVYWADKALPAGLRLSLIGWKY